LYKEVSGVRKGSLPETERAARQVFSLPIHAGMTSEEVSYVGDTVKRVVG
jgi:dTDP-4-amino-4,6-dideoxygalactose transaminase